MGTYVITDFGAVADGKTLATAAIAAAIQAAAAAGGGRIEVPSGIFKTGSIRLASQIELHLQAGAVLSFSDNPADYPIVDSRWEGVVRPVHASCIYGEDLENIAVTGTGKLEGNGQLWWDKKRNRPEDLSYPRPKLISFERSNKILLRDLELVNSPCWTVNPICCQNVTVDNLSILNPADSPNTDGVNPESCQNVRISNCQIDVGDDCIAIKAGTEGTAERVPCENVTITNCTMVHGHGGVVIGSEMSGDIRNVTISNCVFQQTDRGIRLKSRRGRGGIVEDIRVSNVVMDEVLCPFILNLYYFCGPGGKDKYVWDKRAYTITAETPQFRRIHFADITARNVHAAAGFIYGLAEQYIAEISFSNIAISMAEEAVAARPAMMTGIEEMAKSGFYLGNVRDIRFSHVTIDNHQGPAFYVENGEDLELDNCRSTNTLVPEELLKQVTIEQGEV